MTKNSETNFQTPNPEELKKAAKEDPLHKREGAKEADVIEKLLQDDEAEGFENSQTIVSNLGGQ